MVMNAIRSIGPILAISLANTIIRITVHMVSPIREENAYGNIHTGRQGIGTRVNIRNPGVGLCSAYEFSVNYLTMSDNCNMIDLVR